jgi:signal transduction histidine kinase
MTRRGRSHSSVRSREPVIDEAKVNPYPFGMRDTRMLERALLITIAAAVVTGTTVAPIETAPLVDLIPPILAAAGVGIAWRRPTLGIIVVIASPLLAAMLGTSTVLTWSIVVMGVFLSTLRGARSRYLAPLAAGAAYLSEAVVGAGSFTSPSALAVLGITFAAAATGSALREHLRFLHSLEQRAIEAIRSRTAEAGRRVTEERLRIARDLHDVVGHEVAVVNMNINVAEVTLPAGAMRSREALHAARDGVRAILQESQRILDVLRLGDGARDDPNAPSPSLDRIGDLVASYRALGMDVETEIATLPGPIDNAVSATGYRVIQEALTNAHRYGKNDAFLRTEVTGRCLTIRVDNSTSPDAQDGGSGYGLMGMRERVQSVGGQLTITDRHGRFLVEAVLRLDGKDVS